jgi:chromatin assembly factor 1 subunit A
MPNCPYRVDRLRSILSSLPPSLDSLRQCRSLPAISPQFRTCHSLSVRRAVSQLTEAEIAGDISLVRSLLSKLSNPTLFIPKVFIFAEDSRPGYFGTRTRNSAHIGPRSPFKKDPVIIDYGYDSGEDWEDEGSGDADDVVEDSEDDGQTEEPDSDTDSWLVDDDDEVMDVRTPSEEKNTSPPPPGFDFSPPPPKRKSDGEDQKLGKRRKAVVPLVPFSKGPCWESTVGQCESDLFKSYRIQLFNGNVVAFIC